MSVLRLALLALLLAGCQATDAPGRLETALDRMEALTARLELNASAEARGSAALGGGFTTSVRASGELVPPDRVHLVVDGSTPIREVVIVGQRIWVDGGDGLRLSSRVQIGPLREAQAPLRFIRGPGRAEFAGFGLSRGVATYRVRMELDSSGLQARLRSDQPVDPDSSGVVEVEIGLFDGLIRRQSLEVFEPVDPFSGSGLTTLRTVYTIEYWDHGHELEVREPD